LLAETARKEDTSAGGLWDQKKKNHQDQKKMTNRSGLRHRKPTAGTFTTRQSRDKRTGGDRIL